MASAKLTPAQLKVKLEAIEVHADSNQTVKNFARERTKRDEEIGGTEASTGEIQSRLMTTLNGDPVLISLVALKDAVSWFQNNEVANLTPFKARIAVLEIHVGSPDENKAYLQAAREGDARIGIDDQEATDRYNALLDAPPATIDQPRLARLTKRWKDSP
jgi:hypothetical protein